MENSQGEVKRQKINYNPDNLDGFVIKERPKRQLDGLFHFICEECGVPFTSKSISAKTCNQLCRNIKNYRIRSIRFSEENVFVRELFKNSKILEKLFNNGMYVVNGDQLYINKFNIGLLTQVEDYNNQKVRFYGRYGLVQLESEKFKIIRKDGI